MNAEHFANPQAAALYSAAARGDLERAKGLIGQGAGLNSANAREQTLLDVAMLQGQRRAFDTLLKLGADPAYLGDARDTSLHLAAALDESYWLQTLLAHGAPTEARNRLGETPLFRALGTPANVALLLAAGADVRARAKHGDTLLHKAAGTNSFAEVPRLLERGVDPRATDRLGKTFQYYLFMGPAELQLSDETKAVRAEVRSWLQQHGIPIEEPGRQ